VSEYQTLIIKFLRANLQWIAASLTLAFGIWLVAVGQSDPIVQGNYSTRLSINYIVPDDVVLVNNPTTEGAIITLRAPESDFNSIRPDQIVIEANLNDLDMGVQSVELRAQLDDSIRGEVIDIIPNRVEVVLEESASQRLPIQVVVTDEPAEVYTYPTPTCDVTEVTATGPASSLANANVEVRLDLSDTRNPVTLTERLFTVNANGTIMSDIMLERTEITCSVEVTQREGFFILSVVPVTEGTPPEGYIYQGADPPIPSTITVTGNSAIIRNMQGIANTIPIDVSAATSSFEVVVSIDLPTGVQLSPPTQSILVPIKIGTLPGTEEFANLPIQIEGLSSNLDAELLPANVTVLIVAPQPVLDQLTIDDLVVVLDVSELESGSYQISPQASILISELNEQAEITVQPPEISVTLTPIETED